MLAYCYHLLVTASSHRTHHATAEPFDWHFARKSLDRLLERLTVHFVRQMRPVSWAHMATSTRFRAPSFRVRLARWALTVLGVM
jgi:hypothetical protein